MKYKMTVCVAVEIGASPETVWDYTQDWTRRAQWDPSIKEARIVKSDPQPVVRATSGGGTAFTARYKRYERPRRTSLAMTDCRPDWMGGGGAWKYEATKNGTMWTQTNTLTIAGWWRIPLWVPFFWPLFWWNTKSAMHRAKSYLESKV